MKRNIIFPILLVWAACTSSRAAVQPIVKLTPQEPALYYTFGSSVSLDGPTAIASANNIAFAGRVNVYRDNGQGNWSSLATLIPSDSQIGDKFGWSTSLNGSTALIGAPRYGSNGAAYVFEENEVGDWNQVAKLTPTGAVNENDFGYSVSLSDSAAIVGAYSENRFEGAAYIFKQDESESWNQIVRLQPTGAVGMPEFGASVSLSGTTALVGAITDNNLAGAAYIFREDSYGSWNQVARITPDGITDQADFGFCVSLEGTTALIGAPWTSNQSGAAFVFREDESGNWNQIAELVPDGIHTGQLFGWSVSLSGSTALISDLNPGGQGTAYLFREDEFGNWTQIETLTGERSSAEDAFGFSVALNSRYALVSDLYDNQNLGAVYIFQIPEPSSLCMAVVALLLLPIRLLS